MRAGKAFRTLTAAAAVAAVVVSAPAGAAIVTAADRTAPGTQGDPAPAGTRTDRDNRAGALAPTSTQRASAAAGHLSVRWNRLGTPATLTPTTTAAPRVAGDAEQVARAYLTRNGAVFGLGDAAVAALDVLGTNRVGAGTVVLLRQRFGDLPAARDGLVAVAVKDGAVVQVTSSLSRDTGTPAPATLSAQDALTVAARDAGLAVDSLSSTRVREVAVPTPADGPRAAYEVVLISDDSAAPAAYTSYVDARTREVLIREDLVDFDSDNPRWAAFPANPSGDYASTDVRQIWCASAAPGCARTVRDPATGNAWDVDAATGTPTGTSSGNSVLDVQNWAGPYTPAPATTRPDRTYTYPWTNQWFTSRCDPATLDSTQHNDIDAAITNLFAMHNRMHDWSYHLGFTESAWNLQEVNVGAAGTGGDAEQGRAQQGASDPAIRNNANQATPPDGMKPTTNMFLWQPRAGSGYPPCVDGDYDMTVIGHEYTHAISNRMIAGPDTGIESFQGRSMGESWSDLVAIEYLYEYGFRPVGVDPYIVGGYVTGDPVQGIRNYDMSRSPLNYSDVGYDLPGPEVHSDGEIWNALNFDLRRALVGRYGAGTPAVQRACADGARPVEQCPGNRRWVQLVFDSFLLQASPTPSMLDMRDAMLAADELRFGGADTGLLWNVFASRGMGSGASSNGGEDSDPVPGFASPTARNGTLTFTPLGAGANRPVRLYVGNYEARATPVADTDPATPLGTEVSMVPGVYDFVAVGPGLGHRRFRAAVTPGRTSRLPVLMSSNLASSASGATAVGDGVNLDKLIDDTEASNWASLDGVAGKQVTVDLAGTRPQVVSRIQVSAMTRPVVAGSTEPDNPSTGQNRFSGLRSFEVLACNAAAGQDCASDAGYRVAYRSRADAFPGGVFRPRATQLDLRTFSIRPTPATHLRLRVVASQCTGGPAYAGEQDDDPRSGTDCATQSAFRQEVRAAEFEAFAS